ncbi:MAG TPA: universal stress protein [Acidobacteriaceae bacterium]|nr:universal stress protein [Acidobacteriaceae bacterium]
MTALNVQFPQTILVATSFADHPSLIPIATAQARRSGARLLLVHVVAANAAEKKAPAGTVNRADPVYCPRIPEKLASVARQLQWQGISCEPVVLEGEPAEQIAALAQTTGSGWVVVGAGSRGADGSVAEKLISRLRIPVFVIGPRMPEYFASDWASGRILLPVSLHHRRPSHIEFANQLAGELRSHVALLHVLETSSMTFRQRQQTCEQARIDLASIAARVANPVSPMELLVREGNLVRAIVEEALCPHRDFIVMGTGSSLGDPHARTGVVHQVISGARCPVMAVHSSATDEAGAQEISTASAA